MSESSTLVTEAHFRYLADRTISEDRFLQDLKRAAAVAGIPAIHISPEQASFMQILLKLCGAKQVLEVGTLAGYAAIAMARALPPGGRVQSVEIEPQYAEFARQWIARSDIAGRVEVHCGDARDLLPTIKDESVDAAFIDADKENYQCYLGECLRIVRPGGLLMMDNAFAFGRLFCADESESSVVAIREFNDHVSRLNQLHSIIVPLGDGCWVGVRCS